LPEVIVLGWWWGVHEVFLRCGDRKAEVVAC
jgi:hypothetical protein